MKSKLTIDKHGTERWLLPNGQLHREDEPALEYKNGNKFWYIKGLRHREDGPACEYSNNNKLWYINDKNYSKQEHMSEIRSRKLKQLL